MFSRFLTNVSVGGLVRLKGVRQSVSACTVDECHVTEVTLVARVRSLSLYSTHGPGSPTVARRDTCTLKTLHCGPVV